MKRKAVMKKRYAKLYIKSLHLENIIQCLQAKCRFPNFSPYIQTPPPKVVKKATPAKATPVVKNGAAAKKAESEEDDDDSGKHPKSRSLPGQLEHNRTS